MFSSLVFLAATVQSASPISSRAIPLVNFGNASFAVAKVRVGSQTCSVAIDTGSTESWLLNSILQIQPHRPQVEIEGEVLSGAAFSPTDDTAESFLHTYHLDGILGLDILQRYVLRWTRKGSYVHLEPPPDWDLHTALLREKGPITVIPLTKSQGMYCVDTRCLNNDASFIVDTGAYGAITMISPERKIDLSRGKKIKVTTPDFIEREAFAFGTPKIFLTQTAPITPQSLVVMRVDKDSAGEQMMKEGITGIIGNDLFRAYDVMALDVQRQALLGITDKPIPSTEHKISNHYPYFPSVTDPFTVTLSSDQSRFNVRTVSSDNSFDVPITESASDFLTPQALSRKYRVPATHPLALSCSPGIPTPKNWLAMTLSDRVPVIVAPTGVLVLPQKATVTKTAGWRESQKLEGTRRFTPAKPSAPGATQDTMVLMRSGARPVYLSSDTPVIIPKTDGFAIPSTWSIRSEGKDWIITPAGATGEPCSLPSYIVHPTKAYKWRYYASARSWTLVPQ